MQEFAKPQKYRAICIEKTGLTDTVYHVRYQLQSPPFLSFIAGQTIMLVVRQNVHRSMSIASPPQENTVITSLQDVAPGGPASQWLLGLSVGDPVEFMAPLGRFVLERKSPRKKILIATGTGIAPFRSMLLDGTEGKINGQGVSLYWGLRHRTDVYLTDDIVRMVGRHPKSSFYLTLSKPDASWRGLTGHVQEHVFSTETTLSDCDFYLCGNNNMIKDMRQQLQDKGVPQEQIRNDPYY